MIGSQDHWQEDLFVACPLRDLIPEDHILNQVDRVLDLSWLREQVRGLYSASQGRPSIDPEEGAKGGQEPFVLTGGWRAAIFRRCPEHRVRLKEEWFTTS